MQLSGDQTLEDLIGARSFGILTWHMKQRQLRPNSNVKPWVMWSYLGGENFGFGEYHSYEHRAYEYKVDHLESQAAGFDMEIVGLMTEEEDVDILDKIQLYQKAEMRKKNETA